MLLAIKQYLEILFEILVIPGKQEIAMLFGITHILDKISQILLSKAS